MKRDHRKMAEVTLIACQVCGSRQGLSRHHIVPRGMAQCDDPENLVVLCDTDHRRVHRHELDLGTYLTPAQGAKAVLLLRTVWAAWRLLYPSEQRVAA